MALCRCGRELGRRPHCPECGSTNIYGTPSRNQIVGEYINRAYNCRGCGIEFDDVMVSQCTADPPKRIPKSRTAKTYPTAVAAASNPGLAEGLVDKAKKRFRETGEKPSQTQIDYYKNTFGGDLLGDARIFDIPPDLGGEPQLVLGEGFTEPNEKDTNNDDPKGAEQHPGSSNQA